MKHARQAKILEIIDKEVIETQEEIADRLEKSRYGSYPGYNIKGYKRVKTHKSNDRGRKI